jgi:hypothetical protein
LGAGSADAQHGGPDQHQQQHMPADWFLAGVGEAHQACRALHVGMEAMLAPLLNDSASLQQMCQAIAQSEEIASQCFAAGEALCAAVPCSACCNNPRCSSLHGVSASFALVRGKGCVCGGAWGSRLEGRRLCPVMVWWQQGEKTNVGGVGIFHLQYHWQCACLQIVTGQDAQQPSNPLCCCFGSWL